jgi:hypothetical protein
VRGIRVNVADRDFAAEQALATLLRSEQNLERFFSA